MNAVRDTPRRRHRYKFEITLVTRANEEGRALVEDLQLVPLLRGRMLLAQARRALHATEPRVHHHSITGFQSGHTVSVFHYLAGAVAADTFEFAFTPPASAASNACETSDMS